MSILAWFGPCLQGAYRFAKEITLVRGPKNLHGGGDNSAITSLLELEGAPHCILESAEGPGAWGGMCGTLRCGVRQG